VPQARSDGHASVHVIERIGLAGSGAWQRVCLVTVLFMVLVVQGCWISNLSVRSLIDPSKRKAARLSRGWVLEMQGFSEAQILRSDRRNPACLA